jgi:hypothetical protein
MASAAKQITQAARELNDSVVGGVKRVIVDLERFAGLDPREVFGRTVAEHREAVAVLDETLSTLSELSGTWMRDAEPHGELNRHLQRALRASCKNLRLCRTLSVYLATGKLDAETDEIRDVATRLCAERGEKNLAAMDPEERAALHDIHGSEGLEAWLSTP